MNEENQQLEQIKKTSKWLSWLSKKNLIIIGVVALVFVVGALLKTYVFKSAPKQIYEVAIMVRSQKNSDPSEDRKTSLKRGDVLVTQKDGHNWSKTESISYLILRMNLTEEQAQKLTQAKTREISEKELSDEERGRIEEEKQRAKDEDREYHEEPRQETLIAREYYIDMTEFDEQGFKAVDLISGQPFQEEVFDWGIVERKK